MRRRIVLATRRSLLALAQARAFAARLLALAPGIELVESHVVTSGDRIADRPLRDVGGKGLFVKEIEEALLAGEADLAVHSIKDVPALVAPGLRLACTPRREDARDALVARERGATLQGMRRGARVGTGSLRRALQLHAVRPDLEVLPVRGNVDTRIRKVDEGELDAVVLALAGLRRLGREERADEVLGIEVSLPAVGQGALGIECREDDVELQALLAPLSDPETEVAVAAERGVLSAVGGGCNAPFAAHAVREGDALFLRAFAADEDGTRLRRGERRAPWPRHPLHAERLGRELGAELA